MERSIINGIPLVAIFLLCTIIACQNNSSSRSSATNNGQGIHALHFNPSSPSVYYYTVNSELESELETGSKTVNNVSRSEVGITYDISKDNAGNFLLAMQYDKLHAYTKAADKETDMDAANAATTADPVERMLGMVKEARIVATINPAGKVVSISGYKELGDKIMAGLSTNDLNARMMAQSQWDKLIGEGMVKRNMEQLVSVFPDSSVRIGDTWTISSKQKGEIDFNLTTTYTLKDIDDGVAIIESEGDMSNDKGVANIMGQAVTGDLKGTQEGRFEIDTQTGMMLKNTVTAKVEGTIQIMGRDIPVTIKSTVGMVGKRLK